MDEVEIPTTAKKKVRFTNLYILLTNTVVEDSILPEKWPCKEDKIILVILMRTSFYGMTISAMNKQIRWSANTGPQNQQQGFFLFSIILFI